MEETTSTTTGKVIIAALSTLTPPQISSLTASISALFNFQCGRLSSLLLSPTLFSLSLHHLFSLSIHQKSHLIARHLSSILSHLSAFLHPRTRPLPPYVTTTLPTRDLDSVLLLLLLCELHQHNPESLNTSSQTDWRASLSHYAASHAASATLTLSGIGFSTSETLIKYIDLVTKCRNFVSVMDCGEGKEGKEVAASVAAVVALPSVEVKRQKECVICKEQMKQGRDVCELPCEHQFHWMCILPWLVKRNTCPCCRHRLPTDDVYGEVGRQWEVLVKIGGGCY